MKHLIFCIPFLFSQKSTGIREELLKVIVINVNFKQQQKYPFSNIGIMSSNILILHT